MELLLRSNAKLWNSYRTIHEICFINLSLAQTKRRDRTELNSTELN